MQSREVKPEDVMFPSLMLARVRKKGRDREKERRKESVGVEGKVASDRLYVYSQTE